MFSQTITDEQSAAPAKAKILLVDDRPANLLAMEGVLAPLGHELVLVDSGEAALRALLQADFAAILMDVQMPGLDGLDTAALIRTRERTRHVPILFITALNREAAYVTKGYAAGAVDYLLKPVDPNILRSKVAVFAELYLRGERVKQQALELAERRRLEEQVQREVLLEQRLVGMVGHDIRSPLGAIQATAQAQLSSEALGPVQRRSFERILRASERILKIADTLLDLTRERLGGGIPVTVRPMELGALCRRIADEVQAGHPDRLLRLELGEGEIDGEWDPDRLAQVLVNLLDNALKYSPADSPVRLCVEQADGAVVIEVQNDGEPIPAERVLGLFEPLKRGDAPIQDGSPQGLGLGLYIASAIVKGHHGSIEVRPSSGGMVFRVVLPRQCGRHAPAYSEATPA